MLTNLVLKDTLIIQFKTTGVIEDYDWLVEIENTLIQAFSLNGRAEVDGHDFGKSTMNIFIFPNHGWSGAIEVVVAYLKHRNALEQAVIIKRSKKERYTVVWPYHFNGEFEKP